MWTLGRSCNHPIWGFQRPVRPSGKSSQKVCSPLITPCAHPSSPHRPLHVFNSRFSYRELYLVCPMLFLFRLHYLSREAWLCSQVSESSVILPPWPFLGCALQGVMCQPSCPFNHGSRRGAVMVLSATASVVAVHPSGSVSPYKSALWQVSSSCW